MKNNKEIDLLNKNIFLSFLFIASVIVSLLISYNEKLEKEGKKTFFSNNTSTKLNLSNRVFAVFLVIGFLLINFDAYDYYKTKKVNLAPFRHQIYASLFTLISALIALYVVLENLGDNFQVFNVENPNV